jgi:hypothetical protein
VYELKLDGFRGQAIRDQSGVRLYSRNGKDLTRIYPQVVASLTAALRQEPRWKTRSMRSMFHLDFLFASILTASAR